MSSHFRNENNGFRTKSLFLETSYLDKSHVMYVLSPVARENLPSIYQLFLETEDPTEFKFANTYFDGMEHWRRICDSEWFKPFLEAMRSDLRLKIKQKAIEGIKEEAYNPESKSRFSALKYLADGGYISKEEAKRVGRPNKEKFNPEFASEYKDAYERVFPSKEELN